MTQEELMLEIAKVVTEKYELEKQIRDYELMIKFLIKRENKLQQIETMFKNGVVDLAKLREIVRDK